MLGMLKNKATAVALNLLKEKVVNPNLEGIGVVRSLEFKDGKLRLTVVLEGLEDRPLSIEASEIEIAPDGSSVRVGKFLSNMPFAQNALDQFARGAFTVPEGSTRCYFKMAKKVMGL